MKPSHQNTEVDTAATQTKIKTGLRAGQLSVNHNRPVFVVRTNLRAGALSANHNRPVLVVRASHVQER